jgi:murein DD-endopeptidase MepM/ murein hydrolase activator NlpD
MVLCAVLFAACGRNPYATDPLFRPDTPKLTELPCDTAAVAIIGAYGTIQRLDGTTYFHNGIDITTVDGGKFYGCADGVVTKVELNTGVGFPGTNYRIWIKISSQATIDYHFELGGSVPEQRRRDNIFVNEGQRVRAGQHIANLIYAGDGCHVHFWVMENGSGDRCPLTCFTAATAAKFERLFDSPWVEKRPVRPDLCQ